MADVTPQSKRITHGTVSDISSEPVRIISLVAHATAQLAGLIGILSIIARHRAHNVVLSHVDAHITSPHLRQPDSAVPAFNLCAKPRFIRFADDVSSRGDCSAAAQSWPRDIYLVSWQLLGRQKSSCK